jgi:signal transduction histidine kinase
LNGIAAGFEPADRDRIAKQLDEGDSGLHRMMQEAADSDERSWKTLDGGVKAFSSAVRNAVTAQGPTSAQSHELFRLHEQVTAAAMAIITNAFERGVAAQREIERRATRSVKQSALLLAGSLALALICMLVTLRVAGRLVRGMEAQSGELSRVSWHMLENQETTARRFSHELHDELGQTLTALKANLSAVRGERDADTARIEDCTRLVDDAVRNVRELSQLLHPTILDDFGLDASLRWLADRFTERTGINVQYHSNFNERLPEDKEIHLFRIVQEALTNVARHSGATQVRIDLEHRSERVHLNLVDNGHGLRDKSAAVRGMGVTGMRARARSAGGELNIASADTGGVRIQLWAPANSDKNSSR